MTGPLYSLLQTNDEGDLMTLNFRQINNTQFLMLVHKLSCTMDTTSSSAELTK